MTCIQNDIIKVRHRSQSCNRIDDRERPEYEKKIGSEGNPTSFFSSASTTEVAVPARGFTY